MKKSFLISSFFIVFIFSGQAQFLKFGVKAGANLVKISGVPFTDGYNLGYYAGAFTEVKINDHWFLQPEILFGETDLNYSDEFKDIYEDLLNINNLSSIRLQRLSIPITLNYKLANVLSLSAGPQFSLIMNNGQTILENAGDAFSKGDLGMVVGGNFHLGKLRISGRYIWGLKDINNFDGHEAWKAETAQIGIGFVF